MSISRCKNTTAAKRQAGVQSAFPESFRKKKKGTAAPVSGGRAFLSEHYLSLISPCSCCRDLTSQSPCFCTYRIPFAVALAAAIVVI